ncbi:MAG: hypothetical protein MMC33_004812 [Icmadophila ericetorum]|nr:hypothetical protein [Icmadophila ericetorum]
MRTSPFIKITPDVPHRSDLIYSNGSIIKGLVGVDPQSSLLLSNVSISLKGRITTRIDEGSGEHKRIYRQKNYLFSISNTLRNGGPLVREATTWRFEFQFPETVQPYPQENEIIPGDGFVHLPGHPLPPTWESSDRWSQISYYLEVFAYDTTAVFRNEIKNRLPLQFRPSRSIENPLPIPYYRKTPHHFESYKLDPEYGTQHLSFREMARKVFTASEPKPRLSFHVRSSIPQQAIPGASFPIMIGLEHDPSSTTAPMIPPIYLQHLHVRLTNSYQTRVQARLFLKVRNHAQMYSKKIVILNRGFINLAMGERMEMIELLPADYLKVPENLLPTFSSYTVAGNYMIKVTATIRVLDKFFELELGKVPLLVHPKEYTVQNPSLEIGMPDAEPSSSSRQQVTPHQGRQEEEAPLEEPLPPYTSLDPNKSRVGPPLVF